MESVFKIRVIRKIGHYQNLSALVLASTLVLSAGAFAGELINDYTQSQLNVHFMPEKTVWVLGAPLRGQVVLTNLGKTRLRIDVFGDVNEAYTGKHKGSHLLSCWALAWQPPVQVLGKNIAGKALLSADQFILLEPGGTYAKRLTWNLEGVVAGRYQVRLAYAPRIASPSFAFPENWLKQHAIQEPVWMGMVFSDPVEIEVVNP